MANSTSRRARTKAEKPVPRKKRTLLIPDLSDPSVLAIDRAKAEFSVGHTTRAAARMMQDYWKKSDDLLIAKQRIRELEMKLETVARCTSTIKDAKADLKDILSEFNDRC